MRTRDEHLEWCKQRALEYVDRGDFTEALTSMLSDLGKHPETAKHAGIALGVMMASAGLLTTRQEIERFIKGFN